MPRPTGHAEQLFSSRIMADDVQRPVVSQNLVYKVLRSYMNHRAIVVHAVADEFLQSILEKIFLLATRIGDFMDADGKKSTWTIIRVQWYYQNFI